MRLDQNAANIVTERLTAGKSYSEIIKELRGHGYTQVRGGSLTKADIYNFMYFNKTASAKGTVKTATKATTTPLVPTSFVTSVLDAKWNANKKVSVLKAAYQNY